MNSPALIQDYVSRAQNRLAALDPFIEPPRTHDVGKILMDQPGRFPKGILADLPRLAEISHDMRRDLELAFYGSEDMTPLEFYGRQHAETARTDATWVVERVEYALGLGR